MDAYYTVQQTDLDGGLAEIARRLYGSTTHWLRLYQVNQAVIGANPNVIRPGQHLRVLDLDAASHPARLHTVRPWEAVAGLAAIVARYPTCTCSWQQIYAINRGVIGDSPRHLSPGQQLLILCR